MDYQVVFIATEKKTSLIFIVIPIILFLVGVGMLVYFIRGKRRVQLKGCGLLIFPGIFTTFAAIMMLLTIMSHFKSKDQTSEILTSCEYKVVEGIVENFDRMPYGGHKLESFTVNGEYFEYSDYLSYGGVNSFNQTASHGGPIRENGQKVRLSYITVTNGNNLILRMEISND